MLLTPMIFFAKLKTAEAYADDPLVERFLEMGTEDIDKLLACCEEYGHPCPNELRLTYDTRTGRFDADYQYQPALEAGDLSFSNSNDTMNEQAKGMTGCYTGKRRDRKRIVRSQHRMKATIGDS